MEYDAIIDVLCASASLAALIASIVSTGEKRQYLVTISVLLAGLGGMFA